MDRAPWMRDHNLASMVQAILKLPSEERVIAASVDEDSYRFETSHVYESDCYGKRDHGVTSSPGLKVWHAIDLIHDRTPAALQEPEEDAR